MNKINILDRDTLQNIREMAEGMASGNLNPLWTRAYTALADAADRIDALHARCTVVPDGGWADEGAPENICQEQCQPVTEGMQTYIGCKVILAEPMDECTFLRIEKGQDTSNRETREGYKVRYPDGYTSWSPENVFEEAYRKINAKELSICRCQNGPLRKIIFQRPNAKGETRAKEQI